MVSQCQSAPSHPASEEMGYWHSRGQASQKRVQGDLLSVLSSRIWAALWAWYKRPKKLNPECQTRQVGFRHIVAHPKALRRLLAERTSYLGTFARDPHGIGRAERGAHKESAFK